MSHPLERNLARFAGRARRLMLVAAAARAVTLVLAVAMSLALVDSVIHFQDRGLRAFCSLGLLTAIALGARWVLRAVRSSRFRPVQMALQLEQTFPQLRGRLASAVEFLGEREDDPLAGSAELRRATVREAATDIDRIKLNDALDARPARRASLLMAFSAGLVVLLALVNPQVARIATLRLANPLSDIEWPRVNQLAFKTDVERLPRGRTFEVEVIDTGGASLPDDCLVQYRYQNPDGSVSEESEPLIPLGGQLLARREGVDRPFEYRAVGGDDHLMRWRSVELVEPPILAAGNLTLHFPDYTGWPARESELNTRALVGTKIAIDATSTTPLSTATVRLGEDQALPATLSADGLQITLPSDAESALVVKESTTYWFDLEDRAGFRSTPTPKYEIRSVPDALPTASIEHPQGNIFVTVDAVLPVAIEAHDDLAIARVSLDYLRSDQSAEGAQSVVLLAEPERVSAEVAAASAAQNYTGDTRELSYEWELKSLALQPGTQITFHAAAVDYAGQTGQSLPRRMTIVTSEEIQDRLTERQAVIFNELARVLQLQQSARSHVAGLEVQLDQIGKLKATDVDVMQGAGLNQQQVERELTADSGGLRGQIADFLDQLKINRIDGPDAVRQMQGLLDETARLADGPLPDAARDLTAATKSAQLTQQAGGSSAPGGKEIRETLRAAGKAQDDVVNSLERMIDEMKQWVNYRHFDRELGQLSKAQQEIAEQTAAVGKETVTRPVEALDPQQRSDLQKLSQRQLELARRLDRLEQRLGDKAAEAGQEDPLAADAMSDALEHARSEGIAESMRRSARGVEQNKIGQATQSQQQVAEDLQELQDILAGRREHELGRLVKKLRAAEAKLAELAAEQQGLVAKLKAAGDTSGEERRQQLERLSREEQQLREEAERLARSLERLEARQAGNIATKAAGKMGQAADSATSGNDGAAGEQAAAAEKDLAEAQQELAEKRQQAEADLAQEQLARMEDAIASMHERQKNLLAESGQYQKQQAERGHLTRAEAATVRDMARQQLALRDESQELAKTLAGAAVFQFVVESAGREMQRAGEGLERRELNDATLDAERRALARLEQLQSAMSTDKNEAAKKPDQADDKQGGEQPSGGNQQQPKIRSVAELKLLKLVQEQINERTIALDEARQKSTSLTEAQQAEFVALSQEQGRVADLVTNMMQAEDQRPEDDPDQLPDVRQDKSRTDGGNPEVERP